MILGLKQLGSALWLTGDFDLFNDLPVIIENADRRACQRDVKTNK